MEDILIERSGLWKIIINVRDKVCPSKKGDNRFGGHTGSFLHGYFCEKVHVKDGGFSIIARWGQVMSLDGLHIKPLKGIVNAYGVDRCHYNIRKELFSYFHDTGYFFVVRKYVLARKELKGQGGVEVKALGHVIILCLVAILR